MPTYEIRLIKENGEVVYFYFDKEYIVPVMQKSEAERSPTKGLIFETRMSDYREMDGMIIPHVIEVKTNGQHVQSITLQEVELNPEVDDLIFSWPK